MRCLGRLYLAELRRRLALLRRYALGTAADVATFYLIFMGIFLSMRSIVGDAQPEELAQLATGQVVGFLAFYFASMVLSFVNNHLRQEVEQGTLEQLFVSSRWFLLVLLARLAASFTVDLVRFIPLCALLVLSTGVSIRFPPAAGLVFILLLLGVYGFSLILGGCALLFKRTGQLPFLFQILFLGFGFSSLAQLPKGVDAFLSLLPIRTRRDRAKGHRSGHRRGRDPQLGDGHAFGGQCGRVCHRRDRRLSLDGASCQAEGSAGKVLAEPERVSREGSLPQPVRRAYTCLWHQGGAHE